MNIAKLLASTNYVIVLLYGVFLTASFADALHTKKDWRKICLFSFFLLLVQSVFAFFSNAKLVEKLYPFIIHLPLILFLIFGCKKKAVSAFGGVFIAYLCCIPRQWIGILIAALFGRGTELSFLVQILCSFPLLILTMRYVSPLIIRLMKRSDKSALLLSAMPFIYYLFIYATTVYSQVLYRGDPVIVGLMTSFLVFTFFVFAISYSHEVQKRSESENMHNLLRLQTDRAMQELENMRLSQYQAAAARHDMRHHFQYIATCLDAEKFSEATIYIQELCASIENHKVISYCDNEAVNLILSSYVGKSETLGIQMDVHVTMSEPLHLPTNDLCVILSNALDNALNACKMLSPDRERKISIQGYQKGGKTFFQIQNSYEGKIQFRDEMPITDQSGHGVGTLSIAASIKQYGGLCSFVTEGDQFLLRFCI